ncbi:MAG: WD40 repeat domain-containing protein, partial [Gemmataceae bacterium]
LLIGLEGAVPAADPEARRKPFRLLADGDARFEEVKVSPDAKLVVARGNDEQVRVWSLETGKLLHRLDERPRGMSGPAIWFTRDGRHLIVSSSRFNDDNSKVVEDRMCWWDVRTGKPARVLTGDGAPCGIVAMGPDGKKFAAGVRNGQLLGVYLHDQRTGRLIRHLPLDNGVVRCAFTPDGRRLFGLSPRGDIWDWDVTTGERRLFRPADRENLPEPDGLLFTPGGGRILVPNLGRSYPTALVDVRTGNATRAAGLAPPNHRCLATARGGRWLLIGHGRGLFLYETGSARPLHTLSLGLNDLDSLAVSPDDRWLVTVAREDECLKVWKLDDW